MVSVRRNPSSSESSRKRIREEEVGGLRSSKGAQRAEFSFSLQVVEVWSGRRGRGHVDDSGRPRGFKVGNQQTRQKEPPLGSSWRTSARNPRASLSDCSERRRR